MKSLLVVIVLAIYCLEWNDSASVGKSTQQQIDQYKLKISELYDQLSRECPDTRYKREIALDHLPLDLFVQKKLHEMDESGVVVVIVDKWRVGGSEFEQRRRSRSFLQAIL